LECGEDHRFGVWDDLWGRLSNLEKGRGFSAFFEESAACEKPAFCVKAVMLTAVQSSCGTGDWRKLWSAMRITALGCGLTFGEDSEFTKRVWILGFSRRIDSLREACFLR